MPSIVVMARPAAAPAGVTHDRAGMPSRFTVQAPHRATPQPNLVPVRPITSRSTQSRGMSAGTSTCCFLPLIVSSTGSPLSHGFIAAITAGTVAGHPVPNVLRAVPQFDPPLLAGAEEPHRPEIGRAHV